MRLLTVILFVILTGCVNAISQKPSKELNDDQAFNELLRKAKATQTQTRARIQAADEFSKQTIQKTVNTIKTLKIEVKELKIDLHEANKKLDSVIDANTGNPYVLLPISKVSNH